MATKRIISVEEAGRRGGNTTKEKHGIEHYKKITSKGGNTTLQKHGKEHFSNAGKLGAQKRWGNKKKKNGNPMNSLSKFLKGS